MNTINVPKGKNVYFTSDHHFGAPTKAASKPREERFISWLDHIKQDADVLFILGDLFDFWFEYKYVIPKGFTRVLGKLAELSDQGIEIHFFVGNHDLWISKGRDSPQKSVFLCLGRSIQPIFLKLL